MGISIPQLLIVLVILILLFGTKRFRNIGSDLGNAMKGFRKAMSSEEDEESKEEKKPADKLEKKDADFEVPTGSESGGAENRTHSHTDDHTSSHTRSRNDKPES